MPRFDGDAARADGGDRAGFGLRDRGVIALGKRPYLVLIDREPTADISATRDIAAVWIAGERVK